MFNDDVCFIKGSQEQGEQGTLEDTAERMRNELNNPRFPSPLMSQQLRVPGRVPVDQGGLTRQEDWYKVCVKGRALVTSIEIL